MMYIIANALLCIIILCTILLFVPYACEAEELFYPGVAVEFGYINELESYYTKIDLALYILPERTINGVLFGGVEVLMQSSYGLAFCPYSDRYSIGGALNIGSVYATITHYCLHPVFSNWQQFNTWAYAENITKVGVGIRYNIPLKINKQGE